jgi:excisionase family DNA binding protein
MRNDATLTVSRAAAQLGVPAPTLRRWTNRGQVPFLLTPTGQRRFTREQIRQIKKGDPHDR